MSDTEDDAAESAKVAQAARALGEHFDAVVILCTRHEGSRGTRTISKGAGNWHAQYGLVREWLYDFDEKIRAEARRDVAEDSP
jgi:hypothetical protein